MFEIVSIEQICPSETIGSCVDESSLFDTRFLIRLYLRATAYCWAAFSSESVEQRNAEA